MKCICFALTHIAVSPLLCCALLMTPAARLAAQAQGTPTTTSTQATATLTVQITGLRNGKGIVSLTLYRDSKPVETRNVAIDAGTLSARTEFEKIPQGVYAVYVFHDENMNGKLDTNFMRMPLEGYGMSNNPRKRMGKPGFDETNFPVNQPECSIEIKMVYWQ